MKENKYIKPKRTILNPISIFNNSINQPFIKMNQLVYMVHTKLCQRPFGACQSLSVHTKKLPAIVVLAALFMLMLALPVLAAPSDPLAVINNLSSFIFSLIRAIGLILLGFGILQVGLSLKSHDPSQRANGMLTVAGGVVITFTQEILTLITG